MLYWKHHRNAEDAPDHVLSLTNDSTLKEMTCCKIYFTLHFTNIAFTDSNKFGSSGQNALTVVHSATDRRKQKICI